MANAQLKKLFESIPEKERSKATLEGTAYWTYMHRPKFSEKYKNYTYEVTLGLDNEGVKKAKEYGLEVQPANERVSLPYVILKRKVKNLEDMTEDRPLLVDSMQKEINPPIIIGNGSKVICKFALYWNDNGDDVRGALLKVQIRDLVSFIPKEKGMVEDPSGFVVGNTSTAGKFDE